MHLPEITEFGHRHERSSFCIRNNKEVLLPVCSISELQSGNKKPVKTLFQLDFHVCELLTFVGMCKKAFWAMTTLSLGSLSIFCSV